MAEIKDDHVLGKVLSLQSKDHFNCFFHQPVHPQCKPKRVRQWRHLVASSGNFQKLLTAMSASKDTESSKNFSLVSAPWLEPGKDKFLFSWVKD